MDLSQHYMTSLRVAELQAEQALLHQQCDPDQRDYGGYAPPEQGYVEPPQSADRATDLLTVYLNPDSRYHRSTAVAEGARLYLRHLLDVQHEDGTLDLRATNFHCAPTVAFTIQHFAYVWRLLERLGSPSPVEAELQALARRYLKAAAAGLLNGGFHTPNHRWVMVSAHALLHNILSDTRLLAEAELYLREGIDIDEFGEYTERSVGVYNVAVNRSLLITAAELQRPELLEPVARNLDSVLRYWEPDDTLYTLSSRRQDYGKAVLPLRYYQTYLTAGLRLQRPDFLYLAGYLHELGVQRGQPPGVLLQFMTEPGLQNLDVPTRAPDLDGHHHNTRSGLVRIRRGQHSLSLQAGNTRFLKYQVGASSVYLKCATTFFGERGRFVAGKIEATRDGYRLRCVREWGYKRPLVEAPASPLWEDLDHDSRQWVKMQQLELCVDVSWDGNGFFLNVDVHGTVGVLLKLELIFRPGGILDTEDLRVPGLAGGHALHKSGAATYILGPDRITISPGMGEHDNARTMRGSEPPDPDSFIVYLTGYTPLEQRFTVRGEHGPRERQ